MKTKKVYPFINAQIFDLEDNNDRKNVVFDAREVESYEYWTTDENKIDKTQYVEVNFKSGNYLRLELELDQELHPGYNLITAIDMVQFYHFWYDNEDSTPDDNK